MVSNKCPMMLNETGYNSIIYLFQSEYKCSNKIVINLYA
ncbi:hypothetical protein XNC1_3436 [Xenorhabdus nematophila ATCC 19061]|uniref:Uncharacterized protein n=3 Tax=Xenorhabdus TaxID=626 RepID=D3V9D2_XENNA|nr:hypothetical protein XBJ1_2666 [Xenorhabdus bovienii SS-2004]CBJ91482.1 hypothetical protein XNC1_3436 [Xenorhabdus nematophila ATCC 19061]CDH04085.1 hypothetical protein XBO1_100003 [Xenorhabdus bovienii str. oregonense]CDH27685.1 hypothetical protein XBJ2_1420003 [Xenorhabdus bovienii str. Jollieti]CEK24302.1 hypothetical protein XNC2_3308 [Xenorhabdus nematophila AN6/1]